MSSYNRLNGFYTSENYDLLANILRKEWNFKGIVMSDWGGGADAVAQINAGNDLIMPGRTQNMELLNALKNKTINEKVINENVSRILTYILKTPSFNKYKYSNHPDLNVHVQITGAAKILAMDNGDPIDLSSYKTDTKKAFRGKCLLILQATDKKGAITVNVRSEGLSPKTIYLNSL